MDEISSHLDSAEHEQWYQRKTAMQSFREAEELHQRYHPHQFLIYKLGFSGVKNFL